MLVPIRACRLQIRRGSEIAIRHKQNSECHRPSPKLSFVPHSRIYRRQGIRGLGLFPKTSKEPTPSQFISTRHRQCPTASATASWRSDVVLEIVASGRHKSGGEERAKIIGCVHCTVFLAHSMNTNRLKGVC